MKPEVVSCLLQTYSPDDVIPEIGEKFTVGIQPSTVFPSQYEQSLHNKSLSGKEI